MTMEVGDLTPVHVRGRKFRGLDGTKTPPAKRQDSQLPLTSERPAKRQKRKSQGQGRKLSRLESLPTELIEHIFLECLEYNLPRASPYLAASLSSESLYRSLILYALWNDPDRDSAGKGSRSARAVSRIFRPLHYIPLSVPEQYSLQTEILPCRWCTVDRVKRYLRDLVMLSLNRWLCGRGRHADGVCIEAADVNSMAEGLGNHVLDFNPPIHDREHGPVSCSVSSTNFLRSRKPVFGSVGYGDCFPKESRIIVVMSIPHKLIVGSPLTAEDAELLRLFSGWASGVSWGDGGTSGAWRAPVPRIKLQEGIHAAITEQNPLRLRQLLEISAVCKASSDLLPQHFLTAVRKSEDSTIFKLLIRACASSCPRDDPEITAWAMRLEKRGDWFGRWLLDFMAGAVKCMYGKYPGELISAGFKYDRPYEHQARPVTRVNSPTCHNHSWIGEMTRPATVKKQWSLEP